MKATEIVEIKSKGELLFLTKEHRKTVKHLLNGNNTQYKYPYAIMFMDRDEDNTLFITHGRETWAQYKDVGCILREDDRRGIHQLIIDYRVKYGSVKEAVKIRNYVKRRTNG